MARSVDELARKANWLWWRAVRAYALRCGISQPSKNLTTGELTTSGLYSSTPGTSGNLLLRHTSLHWRCFPGLVQYSGSVSWRSITRRGACGTGRAQGEGWVGEGAETASAALSEVKEAIVYAVEDDGLVGCYVAAHLEKQAGGAVKGREGVGCRNAWEHGVDLLEMLENCLFHFLPLDPSPSRHGCIHQPSISLLEGVIGGCVAEVIPALRGVWGKVVCCHPVHVRRKGPLAPIQEPTFGNGLERMEDWFLLPRGAGSNSLVPLEARPEGSDGGSEIRNWARCGEVA